MFGLIIFNVLLLLFAVYVFAILPWRNFCKNAVNTISFHEFVKLYSANKNSWSYSNRSLWNTSLEYNSYYGRLHDARSLKDARGYIAMSFQDFWKLRKFMADIKRREELEEKRIKAERLARAIALEEEINHLTNPETVQNVLNDRGLSELHYAGNFTDLAYAYPSHFSPNDVVSVTSIKDDHVESMKFYVRFVTKDSRYTWIPAECYKSEKDSKTEEVENNAN